MDAIQTYELVKDENGVIVDVKFNGKPVKRGSMRGMRKAQTTKYWHEVTEAVTYAENPFSGVVVKLNALEATVYEWCANWYRRYERGIMDVPVQTYDDMKYFLMELNPNAYFDLLD